MYKDTITLFNRDAANQLWYPTVMRNVDVNADRGAIMASYGANATDNAKLHVRYQSSDAGFKVGQKTYLEPLEFAASTDKANHFTFAFGQENGDLAFDFFMVGDYGSEAVISDDAYDDYDGFYNYMNATKDRVYMVSSCAIYSVIPHFEVLAK